MARGEASKENKFRRMAASALATTKSLLSRYRYRLAGSMECRQAAHEITGMLRSICDRCQEETFSLHPKALWYLGKVIAVIYVVAAVMSVFGGILIWIGALLCLIGLVYGLSQYVFYSRLFDPLFKRAEGCNVVGVLESVYPADRQVVLVSHHDSPYIFNFLERFQPIAFARFFLGMLSYAFLTLYLSLLSIKQLVLRHIEASHGVALWATALGALFAFQLFHMMSRRPSPGAGDNLNSTSMNIEVAKHFNRARSGVKALQHTRIVILSTDGEEIGQRGAMEYVRAHLSELRHMLTYVVNVDSVYYYKDLAVLTRDRNWSMKMSSNLVAAFVKIARQLKIPLRPVAIPFGGGGTDAAAFMAEGIMATGLIAQPIGAVRNDHLYHTSKDVVEEIEERAVEAILRLLVHYVEAVDGAN